MENGQRGPKLPARSIGYYQGVTSVYNVYVVDCRLENYPQGYQKYYNVIRLENINGKNMIYKYDEEAKEIRKKVRPTY